MDTRTHTWLPVLLAGLGVAATAHGQGAPGLDGAISIKSQEAVVDVPVQKLEYQVKWMAKPIAIDTAGTTDLTAGGAIGCALFPEDGDNPESLLRHADHAMYARKQRATATASDSVVRFPQRP